MRSFFSRITSRLFLVLCFLLLVPCSLLLVPCFLHAQERFVQPIASDLPGRTVWGFATSGTVSAPQTFAATDNGLYRRNGTGAWTALTVDAKLKNASASVFAVKVRTVGANNHLPVLLAGTANGVYRSTDGGTTWANVETTTASQRGVLVGKTVFDLELVGSTFFAATEKGVYRSADDGKTWTLVNVDKTADNNQVRGITVFGNVVVVNLWSEGLWRSTNGGATWTKMTIAGESALCRAVYAQQATNGTVWLVGSVAGNIWRSVEKNGAFGTWAKVYSGQTAQRSLTMAMGADAFAGGTITNGRSRGRCLFACTPSGIAYSLNDGATWKHTRTPTTKAASIALAGTILYVGTEQTNGAAGTLNNLIDDKAKTGTIQGDGGIDNYPTGCIDGSPALSLPSGENVCTGGSGSGSGGSIIPAPMISTITPVTFPPNGTQALTITGTDFYQSNQLLDLPEVWVSRNGINLLEMLPLNTRTDTQITLTLPAAYSSTLGAFYLVVEGKNNGLNLYSNVFKVTVAPLTPTITSVTSVPSPLITGQVGSSLTVNGSNFSSLAFILLRPNGTSGSADITLVPATRTSSVLTVSSFTPPAQGTYQVLVSNPAEPNNTVSDPWNSLTIQAAPAPSISAVALPSGFTRLATGRTARLIITGSNFSAGTADLRLQASGQSSQALTGVTYITRTATSIEATFTAPAVGTYTVSVLNQGNVSSAQSSQTVAVVALPTLTIDPLQNTLTLERANTTTLSGTGLTTTQITNAGQVISNTATATSIGITVGAAALNASTPFPITLTDPTLLGDGSTANGTAYSAAFALPVAYPLPTLTVDANSVITTVDPGFTGTITFNGTNIIKGGAPGSLTPTSVLLNGSSLPAGVILSPQYTATSISCTLDPSFIGTPGILHLSLQNPTPGGGVSNEGFLVVRNLQPVVTTPQPIVVSTGSAVIYTLTGTKFYSITKVFFNGTAIGATVQNGGTQLVVTIPSGLLTLGSSTLRIVNEAAGSAPLETSVAVQVAPETPVITSFSPSSAPAFSALSSLIINGTGFSPSAGGAKVFWNGSEITTMSIPNGNIIYLSNLDTAKFSQVGAATIEVRNIDPSGINTRSGTAQCMVVAPVPTLPTGTPGAALSPSTLSLNQAANPTAVSVTVTGTNFVDAVVGGVSIKTEVLIGGVALPSSAVTVTSRTSLTVQIGAPMVNTAGAYIITVRNPPISVGGTPTGGGTSVNSSSLLVVNPSPSLTSLTPNGSPTITAGDPALVTLTGQNFVRLLSVAIGAPNSAVTQVQIAAPGAPGFWISISADSVRFLSASALSVGIPGSVLAGSGVYTMRVMNPAVGAQGGGFATSTFSVTNPQPFLDGVTPLTANAGTITSITLTGRNFMAGAPGVPPSDGGGSVVTMLFNNLPITAFTQTVLSRTSITLSFTVVTAGTYSIQVTNPPFGGGVSVVRTVVVSNPHPTLTSASTNPNPLYRTSQNATLTLFGSGFIGNQNGQSSVQAANASSVEIKTPQSGVWTAVPFVNLSVVNGNTLIVGAENLLPLQTAGVDSVRVVNPVPSGTTAPQGGASSPAFAFVVNNPTPVIQGINPTAVVASASDVVITVSGTDIMNGAVVLVNNVVVPTAFSNGDLIATIPNALVSAAGGYSITVRNPAPQIAASAAQTLTINNPVPTLTLVSPSTVTAGTQNLTLTLTGTLFRPGIRAYLNGTLLTNPQWINANTMTAQVPSSLIQTAGVDSVSVRNTDPTAGNSNVLPIVVTPDVARQMTLTAAPASVVAGVSLPAFTITFRDVYNNLNDYAGTVTYGMVGAENLLPLLLTRTQPGSAGLGVYSAQLPIGVTLTQAGLYSLTASGIATTTGTTQLTVQPAIAATATVNGVPSSVVAGQTITAGTITLTARDAFGNLSSQTSANALTLSNDAGTSTATLALTNTGLGAFTTPVNFFTVPGTYSVTMTGDLSLNNSPVSFVVTSGIIKSAEITNVTPSLTAGTSQMAFSVNFRNQFQNSVDADAVVSYTNGVSGVGSSTGTIALSRVAQGVSTATVTTFTVAGNYVLSPMTNAPITTSGTRTFTVTPDVVATAVFSANAGAVGFLNDSTFVAGQTLPRFTVSYTDRFGNLTDNAGTMTLYKKLAIGDSAVAVLSMTRTSLGTYQSNPLVLTAAGSYTLRPSSNSPLTILNSPLFSVSPSLTSAVEFTAVPDTVMAGNAVPSFTASYRDQYGNLTDNATKSLLLVNTAKALNLTVATTATQRLSVGLYSVSTSASALVLPTSGTYSIRANGIAATNTRYTLRPMTNGPMTNVPITGYAPLIVSSAPASVAAFSLVDTTLIAGQLQTAFRVNASDAFGNPVDIPITVRFVTANGSSSGTMTMTRTGTGLYTATRLGLTTAGVYTLSVDGVTTTTGTRSFVVTPTVQYYAAVAGLPTTILSGYALSPFTVTYRDRYSNLTDSLNPVYARTSTYTRVGGSSTATLQATLKSTLQTGVYQVAATTNNTLVLNLTGTYNFSVAGIVASNLTGTTSVDVLYPLPVLTALLPSSTTATGQAWTLTLIGQNFAPASQVLYNGVLQSLTNTIYVSSDTLRVKLPAVPVVDSTFTVAVQNPVVAGSGGGVSATLPLSIGFPVPVLTSISPASTTATLGVIERSWTLTLNGSGFGSGSNGSSSSLVMINGSVLPASSVSYVSATRLRAVLPASSPASVQAVHGIYSVQIQNPATATSPALFSASTTLTITNPIPVLTAITPTSITAGQDTTIVLAGDKFAPGSTVKLTFGTTSTVIIPQARDSVLGLTVHIPDSLIRTKGTYYLRVVNPGFVLDSTANPKTTVGGGLSAAQILAVNAAIPASVQFIGVDTLLTAGGRLAAFTVRFRDNVNNLVDNPSAVLSYANTNGTVTGTFTLTRTSLGNYRADTLSFFQADTYHLWIDTASSGALAVSGAKTIVVAPNGAVRAEITNLNASVVAGTQQNAFTIRYTDIQCNTSDKIRRQFYRNS